MKWIWTYPVACVPGATSWELLLGELQATTSGCHSPAFVAEAQDRCCLSSCETDGGESWTGTVCQKILRVSLVSITQIMFHNFSLRATLTIGKNRVNVRKAYQWGNVRKAYQWDSFVQALLQWKHNKNYMFSVCVFSLRYLLYKEKAP